MSILDDRSSVKKGRRVARRASVSRRKSSGLSALAGKEPTKVSHPVFSPTKTP